ncbi:MarR family winged helix-turn-helix transcriptional regulator [Lactococcus cremoris]|uniref:Mobile rSAM pair MarR family regulator n=1 Tax=Lactococcus lactis subsp. cremoris TaxID=1359 RepID=A0ABR5EEC1_LACLC|nr:MarR family transcriptional regulator [Lactococcus cremoris]KKW70672.1 mobile rSAM pair MarR family regulator [Lactococcus cremoris]TNU80705.1 MarR family transcriptional regulator [Lactococcus cremoris]
MSEQTNNLLNLFSKLLHNPSVLFALRADGISKQMKKRGNRNGAQGLLVELWNKDGLTNAEIAELLDIKPSSVTAQVKQLEEAEMVIRKQDENDKRVNRIFLTEKGREAQETRDTMHNDISETIFGNLTDEEQKQLANLMEKLVETNDAHEDRDFRKMTQFFGNPFMENMMNAHDRHAFENHMRREMRRSSQEMKRGQNRMRHDDRSQAPFGEDWKIFGKQIKENFRNSFGKRDEAEFNEHWEHFSDEMKNRFGDFDGHHRPEFDEFDPRAGHSDKHAEPKKPENWDDF